MTRVTINIKPIICCNESGNGYLPGFVTNNLYSLTTYSAHGYDRQIAEQLAVQEAEAEAKRYIGDWNVTVQTGLVELIDIRELGDK